ncbi:hypothetical protein E0Z10_g3033 [Xylaria hypoxylon]|uniref:Major facilitator superfamily (MFS) profile domain-containing protein n=1 Tax=Xylaria hypoxylon TaxID=37992 RepID=A0A4Z0Z2V1_9PEZI|nr:hypothetical protein E0Z10_g3033 [Xylaria hypoxylon]
MDDRSSLKHGSSSPCRLNVLIVGGGLFGLAAAISIVCAGHKVTVFETHSGPHEVGAGLQSSPNSTRLWTKWGLSNVLQSLAAAPTGLQIHDFNGKVLAQRQNYDVEIQQRYGSPLWTMHRVDLQNALVERARELGVEILYSSRVDDINMTRPGVRTEDGQMHNGDLVVLAEGVWSSHRSDLLGKQINPEPSGDMAYRMTIDYEQLEGHSDLQAWMQDLKIRIWIGPGSHAVAYPVRRSSQMNIVLLVHDDFENRQESKSVGDVAEMREHFNGWDPILNKMLSVVQTVQKWRLMQLPPLKTWRSQQGTTVLGGDSCHAILPYMAQGLSMGLEDAAVLGYLLGSVTNKSHIAKATHMYERLRVARTARMRDETHKHARHFHAADPELRRTRDAEFSRSFDPNSNCEVTRCHHDVDHDFILSRPSYRQHVSRDDSTQRSTPEISQRRWTWLDRFDSSTDPANNFPWDLSFTGFCPSMAESRSTQDTSTSSHTRAFEITWVDNDDENPKNWPAWYRGLILGFVSFATLVVVIASTAYVTTIPGVMAEFGIADRTIPVLGVTTYLFGLGVGPLLLAPLGEIFGRRPVYTITLFLFTITLIPSAVATNIATILATRFLAAFVGSVMLSNAPGTVNDIATNETRALYVSIWIFGAVSGPVLGPVIAGLINQHHDWRWIHWTIVILSFVSALMMASLKETFAPAILYRKYVRAKRDDDRYWCKHEDFGRGSLKAKLEVSIKRPVVMAFTEPICLLWNTYIAILYALLYLSIVGYPIVFQQLRGWSSSVAGLPFLSIGFGSLICILVEPYLRRLVKAVDMFLRREKSEDANPISISPPPPPAPEATVPLIFIGGLLVPVGMLLFAVSASPPNSPVVAILSGVPFGMGNMLVIIYVTNYLASCYGSQAASAIAGNAVTRNLIGGVLPLLAPVLYSRLGPLFTGLVLVAIALVLSIIPILFWKWGSQLRGRSQLATGS